MGGGLIQLMLKGQMDTYININPDISFYKYGYKKYTNFSMEGISLSFESNPVLSKNLANITYNCKIGRYGDLLNNLYLCYTLPEVYSSDKYRFRWINNIGTLLLKNATITVDSVIIDTVIGEWLIIWNELVLSNNDKNNYNNITANIKDLINPSINEPIIGIRNNKFYTLFYPEATYKSDIKPSIKKTDIILPLNFWFCKNSLLSLPLLQLQNSDIYLNIQIENSENLYQVWSKDLNTYISPRYYNELYNDTIDINKFINNNNIYSRIDANYIFLDTDERNSLLANPINDILVEQLEINNATSINSFSNSSTTINLNIHKLVKEIVWTLKRDDYFKYNENTNYTASFPENNNSDILNKATIVWNSTNNRIEEKDSNYFNKIQPYQHHTVIPKTGIYSYSFAIFPEKFYPTGTYNAANIKTSLLLYTNNEYNNDNINNILVKINKVPYNFNYIANVYIKSYNIFSIKGGTGAMKYS